ncbi:VOC family protein [Arthrobacter sp. A5]|uniref:VOC family protein n=1 Tax=Arthrobacter sp. A5 TaxID=576926 RepID=UPI003DA96A33
MLDRPHDLGSGQSQGFYAQLFGWDYEVGDQETYGGYTTAFKDGRSVAGLMKNDGQSGYPDVWTIYLRVEDINAAVEAVTAADGQIFMPPMVVPEQGSMGMIGDASGAAVGVWQFGGHTGFQAHGEPGAAVWHELHTRDYATAVKFYENVFGWETSVMSDTPEFRYTTLGAAEGARPASWTHRLSCPKVSRRTGRSISASRIPTRPSRRRSHWAAS